MQQQRPTRETADTPLNSPTQTISKIPTPLIKQKGTNLQPIETPRARENLNSIHNFINVQETTFLFLSVFLVSRIVVLFLPFAAPTSVFFLIAFEDRLLVRVVFSFLFFNLLATPADNLLPIGSSSEFKSSKFTMLVS